MMALGFLTYYPASATARQVRLISVYNLVLSPLAARQPIGFMGRLYVYLPTFGLFLMVNVGKSIHGFTLMMVTVGWNSGFYEGSFF